MGAPCLTLQWGFDRYVSSMLYALCLVRCVWVGMALVSAYNEEHDIASAFNSWSDRVDLV